MNSKAHRIVNRLLEYGWTGDPPPPGSPNDPWRQSGMKLPFSDEDFVGKRPQVPLAPEEEKSSPQDIPIKKPMRNPRFRWKPPPV